MKRRLNNLMRAAGLIALIICPPVWLLWGQARQFPQDYTETTTFSATDVLLIVLNPASTPLTRKIAASNLLKRFKSCEVTFGSPGSTIVLVDGDDAPGSCGNVSGSTQTITAVACRVDSITGSPSALPILTGGAAGSIVQSAIPCGTSFVAGTMVAGCNQTTGAGCPTLNSYSVNGATCSAPCTVDTNVQTAGGTAKYMLVRFTILGQ